MQRSINQSILTLHIALTAALAGVREKRYVYTEAGRAVS